MSGLSAALGTRLEAHPLADAFLRWQCRVRQTAMRDHDGRPDDGIMPAVILPGEDESLGHIITVLNRIPAFSEVPELLHMAAKTQDPAQRRAHAIQYLSATYFQKHRQFSDLLTATFPPGSPGAAQIHEARTCRLVFSAYAQQFDLVCRVWKLTPNNIGFKATMAHNRLFNPALAPDTVVLGFEPAWADSSSEPALG